MELNCPFCKTDMVQVHDSEGKIQLYHMMSSGFGEHGYAVNIESGAVLSAYICPGCHYIATFSAKARGDI